MSDRAFPVEDLAQEHADFLQQFESYAHHAIALLRDIATHPPEQVDLSCQFTADTSLNASVWSQTHTHQVQLHIALPTLIHYACNLMISFPDLFPNVGDISQQAGVEPIDHIPMTLPDASPEALSYILGVSRPVDDDRAHLATFLTEVATSFCIFHEIAHIVCGHTAVAPGALMEFYEHESAARPDTLNEHLEFEADIHAGYMLASSLLHRDNQTRYQQLFKTSGDAETQSAALRAMVTALFILFMLMAEQPSRTGVHPPPITRLLSVIDEIRNADAIVSVATLSPAEFDQTLFNALNKTHDVWQCLGLAGLGDDIEYTVRIAREHQLRLQDGLTLARKATSAHAWGISTLSV